MLYIVCLCIVLLYTFMGFYTTVHEGYFLNIIHMLSLLYCTLFFKKINFDAVIYLKILCNVISLIVNKRLNKKKLQVRTNRRYFKICLKCVTGPLM